MTEQKHLWETKHAYYCAEENYYKSGCNHEYESWQDFYAEMGDSDLDYNLLFRWDWQLSYDEDADEQVPLSSDPNCRDCDLNLFFMGQRKGLFYSFTVKVCQADEPEVRKFLQTRWNYLKGLWSPLSCEVAEKETND